MPRRLIVNADDFGFTQDVNEGILTCHTDGILTATTLMATGKAFKHAVEISQSTPSLDIGCHLVILQEPNFPPTVPALISALVGRQINPYAEFSRQITAILHAGLRPTHLDTHKHTHLLPPILNAVLRVSQEFHIPFIRKPADFARDPHAPSLKQHANTAMRFAIRSFDRKLAQRSARHTDHFTGFQLTGRLTVDTLGATLRKLPEGTTELMCHPGFLREQLARSATRLKQSRAEEVQVLCSPAIRALLAERNIQLTRYRDL